MVKEVTMPQLATYEIKPYFYLERASQGVIFVAPVGGATTPNSQNPRSELRQMRGSSNAAWSNKSETWNMEAEMAFYEIPNSSDPTRGVVGLQIHDGNDDVTVLRLEDNGDLWVTKGDTAHHIPVNSNYVMRTFMKIKVIAKKGGGIEWWINGTKVATISGVYSGCYFKAGCYTQCAPNEGTGRGVTVFRKLKVWRS